MPSQKQEILKIEKLRRKTEAFCKKFPQADRSVVYHTLLSLTKPPLERLNTALIRAKKHPIYT